MVLFFWLISGHRSKFFWNDWQKLSQFGHNVWKGRLVNTDMACINTVVGKMTKMSQRKTKPRLEARSSPIPNIILKLLVENWTLTNLFPRLMNLLCMHFTLPCTNYMRQSVPLVYFVTLKIMSDWAWLSIGWVLVKIFIPLCQTNLILKDRWMFWLIGLQFAF